MLAHHRSIRIMSRTCPGGEIGRRSGFKIRRWITVSVQVRPRAPYLNDKASTKVGALLFLAVRSVTQVTRPETCVSHLGLVFEASLISLLTTAIHSWVVLCLRLSLADHGFPRFHLPIFLSSYLPIFLSSYFHLFYRGNIFRWRWWFFYFIMLTIT